METTYKPHSYADPVTLPSIPESVSLSSTRTNGLQHWFKGLSSTPVSHFTPEALEVSEERWKVKWEYFNQTFQEDVDQPSLSNASKSKLLEHLDRLESEFTRLKDRMIEIDSAKATAEVATGVQFILSLIENQGPVTYELKSVEIDDNNEQLKSLRKQIKIVDRVHKFALQSSDTIHRMKVMEMISSRLEGASRGATDPVADMEKTSENSIQVDSPMPGSPTMSIDNSLNQPIGGHRVQLMVPRGSANWDGQRPASSLTPVRSSSQSYPPRRHDFHGFPDPERRRTGAVPQALSTAASHRNNLVSLSAVSFFGAGMAWATVFSGTRGDLVLISWAACCFIVGAISAGSATSLLDADGELINRYKPVRWTVRLLAVWSMIHVFVGVMLVSAAILVLDPSADKPESGIKGGGKFVVIGGRAAGGYSLVICALAVSVALAVRHRYSRRTWFV